MYFLCYILKILKYVCMYVYVHCDELNDLLLLLLLLSKEFQRTSMT